MVKELMHDPIFLAGKSKEAAKEDVGVANDLLETLMVHRESCVGMAANMIGVRKRSIRPWKCKHASKHSPIGRHKLFSTKSTIAMEC